VENAYGTLIRALMKSDIWCPLAIAVPDPSGDSESSGSSSPKAVGKLLLFCGFEILASLEMLKNSYGKVMH
jgi:hypothetical protein